MTRAYLKWSLTYYWPMCYAWSRRSLLSVSFSKMPHHLFMPCHVTSYLSVEALYKYSFILLTKLTLNSSFMSSSQRSWGMYVWIASFSYPIMETQFSTLLFMYCRSTVLLRSCLEACTLTVFFFLPHHSTKFYLIFYILYFFILFRPNPIILFP